MKYFQLLLNNRLRIIEITSYSVLFFLFFHGFMNSSNLDFADLGSFSYFPISSLDGVRFDWYLTNLGGQGHVLYYQIVISFVTLLLNNAAIALKVWMLSLIAIASLNSYCLFKYLLKEKKEVAYLLAIIYTFNPITAGLFFFGSINDTYTVYAFMPLLILLSLKISQDSIKSDLLLHSIGLGLVWTYVFYWNPEIVVDFGLFYFFYVLFSIITNFRKSSIKPYLISFSIVLTLFLFLTGSYTTIFSIIVQGPVQAFATSSAGASTYSEIFLDLSSNFHGQLPFYYWYCMLPIFIGISIFSFYFRYLIPSRLQSAILGIQFMSLLILLIWFLFNFNITILVIPIARFLPELGALEPFFGIGLFFCAETIGLSILLSLNFKNAKVRLPAFIRSNPRNKYLLNTMLFLLIIFLLISSIGYWRQNNTPSQIDYVGASSQINVNYTIPNYIESLALWMHKNTNLNSEYRIFVVPQGGLTNEAILNYMPWTSEPTLTNSYSLGMTELVGNHNFTNLAKALGLSGVEYFIVIKGTHVISDQSNQFQGPIGFTKEGFPWQQSNSPHGSWENWTRMLC